MCASSTAGPLTSAFFNPALAASVTFHCSGHTLLEYAQVYWLGPVTGKGWGGPWGLQELPGAGARHSQLGVGTYTASWWTGFQGPAHRRESTQGLFPGCGVLWGEEGAGPVLLGCCCGARAPLTGVDLGTPPQFQSGVLP